MKAFKKDLAMDRLSYRFLANQFRLFIHALAYVLILCGITCDSLAQPGD